MSTNPEQMPLFSKIEEHTILKTPTYVGGYTLGRGHQSYFQINFTYKPNWFHRTMMKLCFGWEWVNF